MTVQVHRSFASLRMTGYVYTVNLLGTTLTQSEGTLVVHILVADWPILISQVEYACDDDSNPHADGKENPVGGKSDEDCDHDCGGNQQPTRTFDANHHSVKKILAR